jgi:hypothetical protein
MKSKKAIFKKLKVFLLTFCGYFYLWITLVSIVGNQLIKSGFHTENDCTPYFQQFGGFGINCENILLERLYNIFISFPRLLVMPANIAATMIALGIHKEEYYMGFLSSIRWILYSTPLILLGLISFIYWKEKNKFLAWFITLPILVHIVLTGASLMR